MSKSFVYLAVGQGKQQILFILEKDLVVVEAFTPGSRWRDRWPLLEDFVLPALKE